MDALSLEFHRRVREGYLALMAQDPARWVMISASGSRTAIQDRIRAAVLARLPQKD
jgi:dTMP kinase